MKNVIKKYILTLSVSLFTLQVGSAQKKYISITIDDVPNTAKYEKDDFKPLFLITLDSMGIPFTIFINEEKLYKTEFKEQNIQLLESWISNERSTLGNHTYSHPRYSAVGLKNFIEDIEKGELVTNQFAEKHKKRLAHFRFPFNDLGIDSLQHLQLRQFLNDKGYTIAPFTVESSDWMFDFVYKHYLDKGEIEKANEVGKLYVEKTIEMIRFFEKMAESIYNRQIRHIYLCHDNAINADYLAIVVDRLYQADFEIISYEEALKDPIYQQEDKYYKNWGVSWLYRWMDTQEERVRWMKQEPDLSEINELYEEIEYD